MEHATELQSSACNGKQQIPESECKARVQIVYNPMRYTKNLYYMRKEQIGCLGHHQGPIPHKKRDQMSKLSKLLNTHHESIEATI